MISRYTYSDEWDAKKKEQNFWTGRAMEGDKNKDEHYQSYINTEQQYESRIQERYGER